MAETQTISFRVVAEFDQAKTLKQQFDILKTGVKDLDYQFRQGKISGDILSDGLKAIELRASKLNLSYKDQVTLVERIHQVNKRAEVGFQSLAVSLNDIDNTLKSKVAPSVVNVEQELKNFYREQRTGDRTMREATQTVMVFGDMIGAGGIGKVINNVTASFQQMEFATTSVGIAATTAGGKYSQLGQKLIDLAGPSAAGAAAIAGIAFAAQEAVKITERLTGAIEKLYRLNVEGGNISKEQQIGVLSREINELSSKRIEAPSAMAALLGPSKMMEELAAKELERQSEIQKRLNEIKRLNDEIANDKKKQLDEIGAKEDESRRKELDHLNKLRKMSPEEFESEQVRQGAERGTRLAQKRLDYAKKRREQAEEKERAAGRYVFDDAKKEMTAFQSAAYSSFKAVGHTFETAVGSAIHRVFGEANTLLSQFAQAATEAFLNMLIQLGVTALGNAILPGAGTAAGALGSVRPTQPQGPAVPVAISYGMVEEMRAVRAAIESIDLSVDGVRIYTKTQQGKRQKSTRTW